MKLIIPTKILKAATIYIGKYKTRYSCLSFEDGKVIATNGHNLLVWRHGTKLSENKKDPDFLMHFNKNALKFVKAAGTAVFTFEYDTETHILSNGYGQAITLGDNEDTDFPEWRKVIPDTANITPITQPISTLIIASFEAFVKVRKGAGVHGFTILPTTIDGPFFLMSDDFDDCYIVAMPMGSTQTLENHLETIDKVMDKKKS